MSGGQEEVQDRWVGGWTSGWVIRVCKDVGDKGVGGQGSGWVITVQCAGGVVVYREGT